MHKVKTGVPKMYMKCTCTSPRIFCHKGAIVLPFYLLLYAGAWSSYLATTVRSAPVVSLHNATLATAIQGTFTKATKWIIFVTNHPTFTRLDPVHCPGSFEGLTETMVCGSIVLNFTFSLNNKKIIVLCVHMLYIICLNN